MNSSQHFQPNEDEATLLEKGLSFIPTVDTRPTPDYFSPQKEITNKTTKYVIEIKQTLSYNTRNCVLIGLVLL